MKTSKLAIPLFLLTLLLTAFSSQATAAGSGSITGNVYCDEDKNGVCDCEEGGLKNIHIQVFFEHCGGTPLQTVSTDEEGNFTFKSIEAGTYFVHVDLDYVCGGRLPTTSNCQQVKLAAGEIVSLPAFGFTQYGQ